MASDPGKERVGIIGVGRMGLAMAQHLIRHGYAVAACDIDPTNVAKAAGLGAHVVGTPQELAKFSTFIILGVGYDEEVNQVMHGPHGVLGAVPAGAIVAVSSTVLPDTVKALAQAADRWQVDILDAPICRGRFFADQGKLLALFGGKPDVVARGRAVYGTFCSDIAVLGDVGHGQVGKAMNNLLLWITSIGLIETGRIAETTGIDLPTLRDALQISSAKSQALADWDQTSFMWALKDMQIISKMADQAGLALPITGAVKELVKEAKRIKATNPPRWTRT